jgi:esterase/lipase
MTTYFLPGFSGEYNQPEMEAIVDYLREQGMSVEAVEWPHWTDKDAQFVLDDEVEKVWQRIQKIQDDEIAIVAKSIGTHVAIRLLETHPDFKPSKLMLMGVPIESIDEVYIRSYPEVMKNLSDTEIMVLQNERDPFGSGDQVLNLLEGVDAEVVVKPGHDTHAYTYPEEVHSFLS